MALVVGGTTVTGTQTLDATKLTGNLPALNGGSLTGISVSNSSILSGVASGSSNTIGTYVFAHKNSESGDQTYGSTFSGSDWTPGNASGYNNSGTMSGTWRLMGRTGGGDNPRGYASLLVRIS